KFGPIAPIVSGGTARPPPVIPERVPDECVWKFAPMVADWPSATGATGASNKAASDAPTRASRFLIGPVVTSTASSERGDLGVSETRRVEERIPIGGSGRY